MQGGIASNIKPINKQLVEDNKLDANATMSAAEECDVANNLTIGMTKCH